MLDHPFNLYYTPQQLLKNIRIRVGAKVCIVCGEEATDNYGVVVLHQQFGQTEGTVVSFNGERVHRKCVSVNKPLKRKGAEVIFHENSQRANEIVSLMMNYITNLMTFIESGEEYAKMLE